MTSLSTGEDAAVLWLDDRPGRAEQHEHQHGGQPEGRRAERDARARGEDGQQGHEEDLLKAREKSDPPNEFEGEGRPEKEKPTTPIKNQIGHQEECGPLQLGNSQQNLGEWTDGERERPNHERHRGKDGVEHERFRKAHRRCGLTDPISHRRQTPDADPNPNAEHDEADEAHHVARTMLGLAESTSM